MEKQIIYKLTTNFEDSSHKTDDCVEFWLARDLQHLLGYDKWDNFKNVISKAKTACEISGQKITDHFADVGKTIKIVDRTIHFVHKGTTCAVTHKMVRQYIDIEQMNYNKTIAVERLKKVIGKSEKRKITNEEKQKLQGIYSKINTLI